MKLLFALALSAVAFAQTVGTIKTTPGTPPTPAVPAQVVAISGAITCTVTGDTFPAKALVISCVVGNSTVGPYLIVLPPSTAYTFQHNLNADSVVVQAKADDKGAITVQAAANGTPQTLAF